MAIKVAMYKNLKKNSILFCVYFIKNKWTGWECDEK